MQIREKSRDPVKRIGRPPNRPTPSLPFEAILKIRNAMLEAANNAPDEVRLQREMPFEEVVEELNEVVGNFFSIGYRLADGVEVIKSLNLPLTDSEVKNILIQSQLRYKS
jgi:hypothetical protein